MNPSIPSTFWLLSLGFISTGCGSDAKQVANTLEKICKNQCDCPDAIEQWNDISNCKKACRGYAVSYEAYIDDSHTENEACPELGKILKDIEACATASCEYDYNNSCPIETYYMLEECWPADEYTPFPYPDYSPGPQIGRVNMLRQLMHPIPPATLDGQTLHAATVE